MEQRGSMRRAVCFEGGGGVALSASREDTLLLSQLSGVRNRISINIYVYIHREHGARGLSSRSFR